MLDVRRLRVLREFASRGTIAATADALGYTPPAVSQQLAALEREAGGLVGRPRAGAFLRERVFSPGQSVRWDALLEQATGEPLTAAHAAREIERGLAA